MKTPTLIPFSEKIQDIKDEGIFSDFALFEAFATWLRGYVNPWITHTNAQHPDTPITTYKKIKEAADTYDQALQAANNDTLKKLAAYAQFIADLLHDPLDTTQPPDQLIKKPILFYGVPRLVPGLYDKELSSYEEIKLTKRTDGIEGSGNYAELRSLEAAMDCFYAEIKDYKRRIANNEQAMTNLDRMAQKWVAQYYDETFTEGNPLAESLSEPVDRETPGPAVRNDRTPIADEFFLYRLFLPASVSGSICTIVLGYYYAPDFPDAITSLPGEQFFPLWVGFVIDFYFSIMIHYHRAWARRYEVIESTQVFREFPPFATFIAATAAGVIFGFIGGNMGNMPVGGTVIGGGVGMIFALLVETCKFVNGICHERNTAATMRRQTIQAPTEPSQPLLQYIELGPVV